MVKLTFTMQSGNNLPTLCTIRRCPRRVSTVLDVALMFASRIPQSPAHTNQTPRARRQCIRVRSPQALPTATRPHNEICVSDHCMSWIADGNHRQRHRPYRQCVLPLKHLFGTRRHAVRPTGQLSFLSRRLAVYPSRLAASPPSFPYQSGWKLFTTTALVAYSLRELPKFWFLAPARPRNQRASFSVRRNPYVRRFVQSS
jgi:hypothetical protein